MPDKALLKKWRDTQEHWDDHDFLNLEANAFMKLRWRRLNRRAAGEAARLSGELGRGLDLVDVGCAHADFEAWVRPQLRSYTGVEPSKALLPKNLRRGKGFQLLRGTAEKLPLKPDSADFVLIKEVLDHCHGPARVMREAFRVLRPGGELLVTLTNDHAYYKLAFPAWAARVKAGQHDHLFFFHPDQVLKLAAEAGFRGLELRDSHYLRLPSRLESMLGSLPEAVGSALISATDAAGSLALPGWGGSFWLVARK